MDCASSFATGAARPPRVMVLVAKFHPSFLQLSDYHQRCVYASAYSRNWWSRFYVDAGGIASSARRPDFGPPKSVDCAL